MNENRSVTFAIGCAITAALLRLIPLHWLHAVNWDEIEFYRATKWIAEGRLPFRDFWEHHSPLPWFLFAPVARFVNSIDTSAIVAMRWAQVPVWIAAFVLANIFMRNAGISRFARWSAISVAVTSSLLMTSAVEFRVDPVAIALLFGGLVAWQRGTKRAMLLAGVLFCLTGLANLRLGPILVVAVALARVIRREPKKWGDEQSANWVLVGGVITLLAFLAFSAVTNSLQPMWQQLIVENQLGESTATGIEYTFLNRLLVVFGWHVIIYDREFDPAIIDPGGIVIILAGLVGIVLALRRWRNPDELFALALVQCANVLFLIRMKFIYNYHFQTAALLMLPLVALAFERIKRRPAIFAMLALAWCVNAYASLLRGKELDRAYQDVIMREVNARTAPGETVFAGIPWGLQREPAYHFWFLPELARQLVAEKHATPYFLGELLTHPPAALVADRNTMVWLVSIQKELAPYFVRHYTPVWRSLWVPGMNARLLPNTSQKWLVPRTGEYRLYASPAYARHAWFRRPIYISTYELHGVELRLPLPANDPTLQWRIDGKPVAMQPVMQLRMGQRVEVVSTASQPIGVFLLNHADRVLFRQPPHTVTLEASAPRVTHWPSFAR